MHFDFHAFCTDIISMAGVDCQGDPDCSLSDSFLEILQLQLQTECDKKTVAPGTLCTQLFASK